MGKDDFSRFFEHKHYTFRELVGQAMTVHERYAEVSFTTKIRGIEMYICCTLRRILFPIS